MAGLGFKDFTVGQVLTSAQVDGYLMQQTVMRFASASARTTALSGVLAEGMISYLDDTNAVEKYDGSAWVALVAGDIEGITAGTGLSGGGTSGTVTLTNSMATAIDAKGDLIAGTAADTFSRLGVGSNGQILTADSAESTGMKWAAPAGGGKVLQVVSASYSTAVTTTSGTFVNSGFTVSITPSASTSKVLIMTAFNLYTAGRTDLGGAVQITRASGATIVYPQNALYGHYVDGVANSVLTSPHFSFLDSPATTSAITYELQYRQTSGSGTTAGLGFANQTTSLIAMEIGA